MNNKILSFKGLSSLREKHPDKKLIHCHGVFDLFHVGHLAHFHSAKKLGDILVVTLTADRFVNKGPCRPRFSEQQRLNLLAALEVVDYVAINPHPSAIEAIYALRPHYYVKGPDYKNKENDRSGKIYQEEAIVKEVGGKLVFTDDECESSTALLNKFFPAWNEEQTAFISEIKQITSTSEIIEKIDNFSKYNVLVVGEPIIDTYIFCEPRNISTKSPTISAQFVREENYAGGSLAIANHLAALGCNVTLLITRGEENYVDDILCSAMYPEVCVHEYKIPNIPTPRKTRYLTDKASPQRMFELMNLNIHQWEHSKSTDFAAKLKSMQNDFDSVLVADFGHGLFENDILSALNDCKSFLSLNVQSNSDNWGFNPFTKHESFNYLCLDRKELRLAEHDRLTPIMNLCKRTIKKHTGKSISVTCGEHGSVYYDGQGKDFSCPAFFTEVVDTTGAGDAYYAITSLLALDSSINGILLPFIGNCYAGLKTRIIGNKQSVSKLDLIKTIQSITG